MTRFIPIIQIAAAVLSFAELGLAAYLASTFYLYDEGFWTPGCISFFVFNGAWSLLVLAYLGLAPRFCPRIFHELPALAIEWITTLFWFAGSIALARYMGDGCFLDGFCSALRSTITLGFINWLLFLALAILDTLGFRRGRSTTTAAAAASA